MQLLTPSALRRSRAAALVLGAILFFLVTNPIALEDSQNRMAAHDPTRSCMRTIDEVPREVLGIAEDITKRFHIAKATAVTISVEAFSAARRHGFKPSLVLSIVEVESSYRASAVNQQSGATGLMQVQPRAHAEKVSAVGGSAALRLIAPNILVGSAILAEYLEYEDGDLEGALGDYLGSITAGEYIKRVRKQMEHFDRIIQRLQSS